ncbi:MAG: serine/threonine protein kinase [Planctomycetes bacterium]|nr:serine/threonine protein kinase [Planctomycetota bacterium]
MAANPFAEARMADPVGQTIAGYPVEKPLDKGAYDILYQAQTSAQPIAVKLLREDLRSDATLGAAVQAGWEKARAVVHPNLVAAYSSGSDPHFGPYCIEEIVKSRTLRKMVLDGSKIAWRDSLEIAVQLATALKALHDAGVAHGDVHPGCILITLDQDVKLEGAGGLTAVNRSLAGILNGALAGYSAPERLTGSAATPSSDFYGMGASLYFLLAGRDPFPGGDTQAVARAAIEKAPTPLGTLAEGLAPAAVDFVQRLMSKLPAQRYASAAEVLTDLENLRSGKPLSPAKFAAAPPPAPAPVAPPQLDATVVSRPASAPAAAAFTPPETAPVLDAAAVSRPSPMPMPSPFRPSAASLPTVKRPTSANLPSARASGLRPGVPGPDPRRTSLAMASVSGLNAGVAPSESGKLRTPGGTIVFGKLETQVGSTIPQSEKEHNGDDLFRRGQLQQAVKSWQEASDTGHQHAGLRAKIELGNRELRKAQYQEAINEAKWCFDAGQFVTATERAQDALNLAESDVQRSESKLLIDMAKAKDIEAAKKRTTSRIIFVIVAAVVLLGVMVWVLLNSLKS